MTSRMPDVRLGDKPWSRRQQWKNDTLYVWIKAIFFVLPFVPVRFLRALGRAIGSIAFHGLRRARRLTEANLALVFPEKSTNERRALARATYATLGAILGDTLATLSGRPAAPIAFEPGAHDVLRRAMAEGRGVVLVSAHLGPWEHVAASLVAHGVPLVTLVRAPYDPRLGFVYERLRGGAGVGAIDRGAPGATARIVRTLKSGGVLGAPMDLRARVPSVVVPFLGQPAATPVGPARLALRTRAAVVVVTAAPAAVSANDRKNGSIDARNALRLRAERVVTADADGPFDATRLTARLNEVLSARIQLYPSGWVWMHERFVATQSTPTLSENRAPRCPSRPEPTSRSSLA